MNKMKNIFVLFAFILVSSTSTSQTLHKATGQLSFNDKEGVVTYSYYEDANTHQWIKQGKYSFVSNMRNNYGGTYNLTISGNYSKGLKDGIWVYSISLRDFILMRNINLGDLEVGYNATGTIKLTQSYKKGLPDGIWFYSSNVKGRSAKTYFGKVVFGSWETLLNTTFSLGFKDGVYHGAFKLQDYSNSIKFEGNFERGYPDGEFTYNTKNSITKTTYKKSYLFSETSRDLSDGSLSKTSNAEAQMVINDKIQGITTIESLEVCCFTLENENIFDKYHYGRILENTINNTNDFPFDMIGGDLSYYRLNYNIKDSRGGGFIFLHSKNPGVYTSLQKIKPTVITIDDTQAALPTSLKSSKLADISFSQNNLETTIKKIGGGRDLSEYLDTINKKGYKVLKGDINNDSKDDLVIQFQFVPNLKDEQTYGRSSDIGLGGIAIFLNDGTKYSFKLIEKDFNFIPSWITKIEGGQIYIEGLTYGEGDSNCCPSLTKKIKLKFDGSRLIEVK